MTDGETRRPRFDQKLIERLSSSQDGRVVKALDLNSNGQMSAWVRTPLLAQIIFVNDYRTFY